MGNQWVATFYFPYSKLPKIVDVYGCWDNEIPKASFDFYDIYDELDGACLNEGDAFHEFPSWADVKAYLETRKA